MQTELPSFKHWCIVELMGHVKIAGLVTEVEMFGSKLGRCDIPNGDGFVTQYFNGSSLYRLTPVEETIARHVAKSNQPEPVYHWELPQLNPAPSHTVDAEALAQVQVGKTYLGTVKRLVDFGAFIEILPDVEGLLHVSEIAPYRVRDVRDELTEGQQVLVKCMDVSSNAVRLSRKALLQDDGDDGSHVGATGYEFSDDDDDRDESDSYSDFDRPTAM